MDEQQATDKLEELAGGINPAWRLMRLYRSCQEAASGNRFTLTKLPTTEERFRNRAREAGYSAECVNHYLNYIR